MNIFEMIEDAIWNMRRGLRDFWYQRVMAASRTVKQVECPRCKGQGEFTYTKPCSRCLGDGEIYMVGDK